jgi:hypothetical protein
MIGGSRLDRIASVCHLFSGIAHGTALSGAASIHGLNSFARVHGDVVFRAAQLSCRRESCGARREFRGSHDPSLARDAGRAVTEAVGAMLTIDTIEAPNCPKCGKVMCLAAIMRDVAHCLPIC